MARRQAVIAATLLVLLVLAQTVVQTPFPRNGAWPSVGLITCLLFVLPRAWHGWFLPALGVGLLPLAMLFGGDPPGNLIAVVLAIATAWLTYRLMPKRADGRLRIRTDLDNSRFAGGTFVAAMAAAVVSSLIALTALSVEESVLQGFLVFLSMLSGLLICLPMLTPTAQRAPISTRAERVSQRILLTALLILAFGLVHQVSLAFLIVPVQGWAVARATRREAHIQLVVIALTAYLATYLGYGAFSRLPSNMSDLSPVLMFSFILASAYLTVPLALVTEQLSSAQVAADHSARTTQRLIDSATNTVFIATDDRGRITQFSAGAEEILGWKAEDVLGNTAKMFHTQDEIARAAKCYGVPPHFAYVAVAQAAAGDRRDWEFRRPDGEARMLSLSISEVTDSQGLPTGYIGAGEDVTERHRAHEALTVALTREHESLEQMRAVNRVKQDLVSTVSHELRTPITSITGYTELLADGSVGEMSAEQVEVLGRIERNAMRLTMLVEDLLTLSRAEAGSLEVAHEPLDLVPVIREALDLISDSLCGRHLSVQRQLPDQPVVMHGDAHELERVAVNLLSNAIKFTPDGGIITVEVEQTRSGARLCVADTGVGIPEAEQRHLFTQFFRSSLATESAVQGTGLGLSIVQAIVHQHAGQVRLRSTPGRGTTVIVDLPHDPASPDPGEDQPQERRRLLST